SAKLILVGDEAQLPPVNSVKSPALDLNHMKDTYHLTAFQVRLREVVRQKAESGILYEATKLRSLLELTEPQLPQLENHEDFKVIDFMDFQEHLESSISTNGIQNTLIITRSNLMANKFNDQIRIQSLWMEEEISVGDLVMITKNNYYWSEKNKSALSFIANGDVAEVVDIKREEKLHGFRFATLRIKFPDYDKIFPLEVLANLDSIHVNGPSLTSAETNKLYTDLLIEYAEENNPKRKVMIDPHFNALQLKFAYAITCHKSQGGQWDTVFIDGSGVRNMESKIEIIRWLYTAVTRAVNKVYLVNFPEEFIA
ncbi:MAG TPA: ATP-dependent endonuclease, partial [Flavobacteriales bacterium]|nr:ATP-dependent endonuclease [Flavobacteriales bacterium]